MRLFTKSKGFLSLVILLIALLLPTVVWGQVNVGQYPVTVFDYLGREVTITQPVHRIACGYAYTGHVVTMLGRADDIVAVVNGLRRDKVLTELYPHIKELPVPFDAGTVNMEELLATGADLVFLRSDTAQNKSVVDKLDRLGIPYITIEFNSMAEQIQTISVIGRAIGTPEKAQRYIDYYRRVVDETEKTAASIPEKERVSLYHSVNEAVRTDIRGTLPADWIEVTGGINVSIDADLRTSGEKSFATLEQIYLWDPDLIIANESGVPEYILSNQQWAALRAVKNKRVYQIPNGISRWGHPGSLETPLAILWTAQLLYPQYFDYINMQAETRAYYQNFFDVELSDDQISAILDGRGMREPKNK